MIAPVSTVFALMTSGESVFHGATTTHMMSKSWTTIKELLYEQKRFPPDSPR